MKKRLLLIFIVGISFSPSVFASGDGVGPENKASNGGMIYCKVLNEWLKPDNNGPAANPSAPESGEATSGSMTFKGNSSPGSNG